MSEEADQGVKSVVVEDEHRSDGGVSLKSGIGVSCVWMFTCFGSFCSIDNW